MNTADVASLRIHRAHAAVRDELQRADARVSTLLFLVALSLAGLTALIRTTESPIAAAALWGSAIPFFSALLVLLSALRPRLSQFPSPGSWLDVVQHGPAVLLEAASPVAREVLAADVASIGRIAVRKNSQVSNAVHLVTTGSLVFAVALVLATLT